MKRNKKNTRKAGVSPYKRYKKRPCQHCQDITRASREAASRGQGRQIAPMSDA